MRRNATAPKRRGQRGRHHRPRRPDGHCTLGRNRHEHEKATSLYFGRVQVSYRRSRPLPTLAGEHAENPIESGELREAAEVASNALNLSSRVRSPEGAANIFGKAGRGSANVGVARSKP
jgi:hypothetical protein